VLVDLCEPTDEILYFSLVFPILLQIFRPPEPHRQSTIAVDLWGPVVVVAVSAVEPVLLVEHVSVVDVEPVEHLVRALVVVV
jgi:hypothetical protein